ncbi:MAG: O-succinylhomoserine sulfhydrylase [Piscirickettsiaceae bacterium CG_4_9_14_3_um_filter_43_564]|nr:O-succinylhomoserine sulfhydrylase [Thiomicrospira sp.]OIP94205.1 MAG: O-succinylhomoserine sulfhydrylase [Thiomicrospira sp. CG2_30_44_34]PIQ05423.1 MAG: O-succinylhomoserine sulfhydrylase [Piscirickettsiaceae bacterium CG18_big_fil_WC_8_21_14_2_50_44_103]PIU38271.1 MAG: O-succinylhomoserine sulfhydrylase [Piscirickettsiaceae bacterium CG07_land_8_20_14_0_80_44_28]PIW57610.1 MAG: O-succinylhomoserine sulfhydrylase [Piscirickettsiaceae bacterium CG12_big_fil_rev_8_21_14_0_65_44_934]PIW77378
MTEPFDLETLAIRAGYEQTLEQENSEAIFPSSSFRYHSAQQAADRFSGAEKGNVYSRFTNPTVRTFEKRLALLEGGESCVATASGMSAILSTFMGLLEAGDHIVSSQSVFGTTKVLFEKYFQKFGVQVSFVSQTDLNSWQEAITPKTKAFFLETPSNPLTEIADITALAALAHQHDALLVVDNCFCSPALQQPLQLGADIVIHSATKFLDGQGRVIGGAVIGTEALIEEAVRGFLRTAGPTMSTFNAWIFLKGLETLSLRMDAHCRQAQQLAEWLETHPAVERVFYPGLSSHPQFALAQKQQSGAGGLLSFRVKGGQTEAWRVIDQTQMLSITANLGDVKTSITHPATTTHARVSTEAKQKAGVTDNLIRISVGLESLKDIQGDLQRGLGLL